MRPQLEATGPAAAETELTNRDLTNCDREPVHVPGAIQPHGVLLVLAEPDLRIRQVSASLRPHIGLNPAAMVGQKLALLLDDPSFESVLGCLTENLTEPHYLPPLITSTGRRFEALIHRTADGLILELEPHNDNSTLDVARIIRDTLAEVHRAPTLIAVCQVAAERLRALTGFDRVMVYRFRPDDAGAVIAEARREDLSPYLGLTYPATDIPRQVRHLFLLNPLRVRKGNEEAVSPLVPPLNPATGEALDMSRCALRATSPVHLEYLRNMGVSASMTLSIVQEGRLWGMFACHHVEAKYVPHAHRLACQALGHLLAMQIMAKQQAEETAGRLRSHDWLLGALPAVAGSTCLTEALLRLGPSLPGVVNADGVVIRSGAGTVTFGATPYPGHLNGGQLNGGQLNGEQLDGLIAWLRREHPVGVFATSALGQQFPPAGAFAGLASGILALPLSADGGDWIRWCRGELVRTVSWAGDPRKSAPDQANGGRISPRESFAAWAEAVRGQSEPWTAAEIGFVQSLHGALLSVVAGWNGHAGS